jgi:hypothetical protein
MYIRTGYGLDGPEVRVRDSEVARIFPSPYLPDLFWGLLARIFPSPYLPDLFWGLSSLLFNGNGCSILDDKVAGA